jgi:hypothetical protein
MDSKSRVWTEFNWPKIMPNDRRFKTLMNLQVPQKLSNHRTRSEDPVKVKVKVR